MTKEKKIIIAITIVSIILITILNYFLINKNAIIEKQVEKIELQAMETNGSNSYTTTASHLAEMNEQLKKTIIKCGKTNSMTVRAGSSGEINVTFEDEFDVAPNVVVSPVYDYNSSKNGYCDTVITSITTTGFNVRFSNNSDANRTLYISWIAIRQNN